MFWYSAKVLAYLVDWKGVGEVWLLVPAGVIPGEDGDYPNALYTSRLPADPQTVANVLDLLPLA